MKRQPKLLPTISWSTGRMVRKAKMWDDFARKVSAQTVNIGKNKQMFWTSKVWVKVRENRVDSEHWRDAALWCDIGKKGYIRNEQFDNRCAFGQGTTFWFPAGTGTKVSLMSSFKITTSRKKGKFIKR